ncbi:EF-hand domain-containing protein [Stenotrophomonas acidaminiphila]|uniref:EF-hand domain-containing protein n=1 Tax=Stenotrophomonas acidaminiphila TaxID=128780 RepID=UPI001FAF6B94|nr:EF-hand domain-containing protein [Stenotrophomonas acidaminiphila]
MSARAAAPVTGRRLARRLPVLLAALLPWTATAQVHDAGDYLRRMDLDGDGRVAPAEYQRWMLYAFERMDRDGNGVLEPAEQPGGRGRPITREQHGQVILERFRKQDANGDGYLDARELMAPPR